MLLTETLKRAIPNCTRNYDFLNLFRFSETTQPNKENISFGNNNIV